MVSSAGLALGTVEAQKVPALVWPMLAAGCLTVAAVALLILRCADRETHIRQLEQEVARVARIDDLTGLHNRQHLDEQLASVLSAARRYGSPVSVMLVDVDNFKRLNEAGGHLAGDEVLREVGARIRHAMRTEDIVGRWGGDEFMVIMPTTGGSGATAAAERLLVAICDVPMSIHKALVELSVSAGLATGVEESPDQLSRLADAALDEAKTQGGGRAVTAAGELIGVL